VHFLTMELVEGKTLAEMILPRGLAVDQIFQIAIPIADAISAAHSQGITHRDLKPTNIMVSRDGRVKVLDFGLAKLNVREAANDITTLPTKPLTGDGRILGTVSYMSPEQAEGKRVDYRSDIFSLGIILYELATGERPFKGDTRVSVLSSIMKDTPRPVTEINPALPLEFGRILRRCLAKDPAHRYQTAIDLRNDLEELKQDLSGALAKGGVRQLPRGQRHKWRIAGAIGTVMGLAAVGVFVFVRGRVNDHATRFEATFARLTTEPGIEEFPSLSPDGKWVVYQSGQGGKLNIYLQSVTGQTPINLTKDSMASDIMPAFSPDGERIAFRSNRQGGGIFVMGRTGESPRLVSADGVNPAWSPNGKEIVYGTLGVGDNPGIRLGNSQLWAVNIATGDKRPITKTGDAVQPSWSPHGYRIAFWGISGGNRDIYTVPASGGEPTPVTNDANVDWNPVWSPDGNYLYFSSNRGGSFNLWRVPIDEQSGKTRGQPEPVTAPSPYAAHLSFSADGRRLAYVSIDSALQVLKAAFDPVSGAVTSVPIAVTQGSRQLVFPEPSPDNELLVFELIPEQEDLFVSRLDGSGLRQLTNDIAFDRFPHWSPDSKRIAFASNRNGSVQIWTINSDGSGLQPLTEYAGNITWPAWSPDGTRMAANDVIRNKIFIFDPNRPWKAQTPQEISGLGEFHSIVWSPDGEWLAGFDSTPVGNLPGPFPGLGIYSLKSQTYQKLTIYGGGTVNWLNDSRRLIYSLQSKIHIIDIQSKKIHEVFAMPGENLQGPSLSRDNRTLYFNSGHSEGEIWIATLK
jgi:eukaryotic-like serine/threonine-protein kinase